MASVVFIIKKGDTWRRQITVGNIVAEGTVGAVLAPDGITWYTAKDLSTYTSARLHLRRSYEKSTELIEITHSDQIDMSSKATGVISWYLTRAQTEALPDILKSRGDKPGVIALELYNSTDTNTFVDGVFYTSEEAAR